MYIHIVAEYKMKENSLMVSINYRLPLDVGSHTPWLDI
jgi:hypothetical protein